MKKLLFFVMVLLMLGATARGYPTTFKWQANSTTVLTLTGVADVYMTAYDTSSSSGGAFWVNLTGGHLDGSIYESVDPTALQLYSTYCVEDEIHMGFNRTYVASIDKMAYRGFAPSPDTNYGDTISAATEWIYDSWRAGNPNGWSQQDISRAIWYAEDETGNPGGTAAAIYNAAVSAAGSGDARHTSALNLWTLEEINGEWWATDVQSHLITVPAPGAILLAGFGVGFVGWLRNRRQE